MLLAGSGHKHSLLYWLCLASLVFYAAWDPALLPLLLGSIAVNYWMAGQIGREHSRKWLAAGIAFNLALLGWFKYRLFFMTIWQGEAIQAAPLMLPLGISFFTFQQIAFLVDIHRGLTQRRSPARYLLFVSFFPQLVAGPIVHHRELAPQLAKLNRPSPYAVACGLTLLAIGLTKKLLIADNLAPYVDELFTAESKQVIGDVFLAGWAYGMQLYFDFSGYADMAIGLGLLFGIRLPDNFFSPYKATSIQAFWRRWHMTLSRFLRDYLYIPLGGNRHGLTRHLLALFATMLLGGLWHGAGWQFLVWGALHGGMLGISVLWGRWVPWRMPKVLGWFLTVNTVMLAWVPFRAADLAQTLSFYRALANPGWGELRVTVGWLEAGVMGMFQPGFLLCIATLVALLLPNSQQILAWLKRERRWVVQGVVTGVLLTLASKTLMGMPTQAFLYFNF
ncbi:MBOAT family protein [Halomonas sp. ANAO-440]|uniref:MBOAT family O-acyltransferase n=1 Tax=Halomonas sp. ANAO-440 TaxID=2861360 RepID=UPI001CAA416D|nr:MBOAT family protein [Halomonas sp. ANAO-440]MBZ0329365.1 MBOAT family protein [Halomonas sp. ANAO-440]